MDARRAGRLRVLEAHGAVGPTLEEILAYTEKPFDAPARPSFPLADEPHLAAWDAYASDAAARSAFPVLQARLVQLRFPVQNGISQAAAYREATRTGRLEAADAFAPGLVLSAPDRVELQICETIAGRIPVIVAGDRRDFVTLVQAFTARNEPAGVPPSMGACIVTGLNNWDRVRVYRERWQAANPGASGGDWLEEFRRFALRKDLYQDRFILLSAGPYSGVAAAEIDIGDAEWLDRSLVLRREHECTHYYTYRVFGTMRNHVFDELIADFVGLMRAFGAYRADLARRFLGLERFPALRAGGRLELYCGTLSAGAVRIVASLAVSAMENLQALGRQLPGSGDIAALSAFTYALSILTLEELASADMPSLVSAGPS
jgi:hypothetical protein